MSLNELWQLVRSRQPDGGIARTTLGYHLRKYRAEQQELKELSVAAGVYSDTLLGKAAGPLGPMMAQMLRLLAFQHLRETAAARAAEGQADDQKADKPPDAKAAVQPFPRSDPSELVMLARVLHWAACADKIMIEAALKQAHEAEANKEKANKAAPAEPKRSLSHESADAIRRALLGEDLQDRGTGMPAGGPIAASDTPATDIGGEEKQ